MFEITVIIQFHSRPLSLKKELGPTAASASNEIHFVEWTTREWSKVNEWVACCWLWGWLWASAPLRHWTPLHEFINSFHFVNSAFFSSAPAKREPPQLSLLKREFEFASLFDLLGGEPITFLPLFTQLKQRRKERVKLAERAEARATRENKARRLQWN